MIESIPKRTIFAPEVECVPDAPKTVDATRLAEPQVVFPDVARSFQTDPPIQGIIFGSSPDRVIDPRRLSRLFAAAPIGSDRANLLTRASRGDSDIAIHATAVVDRRAEVAASADIGPYAIIDGPVRIGEHVRVYWHATVCGATTIGANCQIHPYATVGHVPQDLAYGDELSRCTLGEDTIVREYASIHRGTGEGTATTVGARCFIMANAHIGHNCEIGDDVKIVNGTLLAGHVKIGDAAFLSGMVGVHQFVRIGELAMIGGQAKLRMDVPPFFTAVHLNECSGVNVIGMRRAGYSVEDRTELRGAYRTLYRSGRTFTQAVDELDETLHTAPGRRLVDFLRARSKRGISGGRERLAVAAED